MTPRRTGGRILAAALREQGVRHVFGVPGESYLPLLIALNEPRNDGTIRYIMARNEGGAAYMAEAAGKMTAHQGIPGVLAVSRGPGLTNAINGIYTAHYDGTPMLILVGSIPTDSQHRKPFQEINYERLLGGITKHVIVADHADRIPELFSSAVRAAFGGIPGPVVFVLPEEILDQESEAADWPPYRSPETDRTPLALGAVGDMIRAAKRPAITLQGALWTPEGIGAVAAYAAHVNAPVLTGFRSQDCFDNDHPNYAGHLGIVPDPHQLAILDNSDCLMVVGAPLECLGSQHYTHPTAEGAAESMILVSPALFPTQAYYPAKHSVCANPNAFAFALRDLVAETAPAKPAPMWQAATAIKSESSPEPTVRPSLDFTGVDPKCVIDALSTQTAHRPTIVTSGAGNSTVWLHQYFHYHPHLEPSTSDRPRGEGSASGGASSWRAQLAPIVGTMGYGIPAGVAAKVMNPEACVIVSGGDGCMQMTAMDMMTAKQYDAPLLVVVFDNGIHGSIRMHQARRFPDGD
ncbi:MAG: hypothetical protein K0U36_01020, partial [Alphaproteobacteria bacterium]|nr:hypothetical protein [Alphaproteobacteria bacterium]